MLVVGLGNPGVKYDFTRHNIGFMMVDFLARQLGEEFQVKKKWSCELFQTNYLEKKITVVKPQTYMNLSGDSVLSIKRACGYENKDIVIIHDDLDLPFGRVRLKKSGGSGGHNGLNSLVSRIGKDFLRLRMGIGRPVNPMQEVASFVLSRYHTDDLKVVEEQIHRAVDALDLLLKEDFVKAQNNINSLN